MNQLDPLLTAIARKHFDLETLESRSSDRLDFKEVSVWSLHDALEAAFKAGMEVGMTSQTTGVDSSN